MILLDTHVWVWWISKPEELSARASEAIDQALEEREIYVSSISVLEVALLVDKGRLDFTLDASDWILKSEGLPYLNFVPVDNAIIRRPSLSPTLRQRTYTFSSIAHGSQIFANELTATSGWGMLRANSCWPRRRARVSRQPSGDGRQ